MVTFVEISKSFNNQITGDNEVFLIPTIDDRPIKVLYKEESA